MGRAIILGYSGGDWAKMLTTNQTTLGNLFLYFFGALQIKFLNFVNKEFFEKY